MKYLLIVFSLTGLILFACKKDKASAFVCTTEVSYSNEIQPLIEMNCTVSGCHDATASGGYNFLTHEEVSTNADRILETIQHGSGVAPMPLGAEKLADSLIQKFYCWKDNGAQNN